MGAKESEEKVEEKIRCVLLLAEYLIQIYYNPIRNIQTGVSITLSIILGEKQSSCK
jgi:hypothetical protein